MKTILLLGLLLASSFALSHAQFLPNGDYTFTADLGPIQLDGRYPIRLGELPSGFADLTTTPAGIVQGTVELLGSSPIPVTGAIAVRQKAVRLRLSGKSAAGPFSANCVLRGSLFTGTIKLHGRKLPAALDVLGAGAISATYELTLASDPKGKITGTGTVTAGRQTAPLAVRGSSSARRVTLTARGSRTVWQGRGAPPQFESFEVDWGARGFGAAARGRALVVNAR
jgi:hypothetical protein